MDYYHFSSFLGEKHSNLQQQLVNYELGDRKSKFDWLDFINKEPKFRGFVNSKFIPEHD